MILILVYRRSHVCSIPDGVWISCIKTVMIMRIRFRIRIRSRRRENRREIRREVKRKERKRM